MSFATSREICVSGPSWDYAGPRPKALGVKFARKLCHFMALCPNIREYVDLNVAAGPSLLGPSIAHDGVVEAHLGFPMLSVQDTALHEAFPSLERLSLHERSVNLFTHSDATEPWFEVDPASYICGALGDELHKVAKLRLDIVLPDELRPGYWKEISQSLVFQCLIERFVNLGDLELEIVPPYTRERENACMMVRRRYLPLIRSQLILCASSAYHFGKSRKFAVSDT